MVVFYKKEEVQDILKKLVIFYDDTKQSCCDYVSEFEKYGNVDVRKASEHRDKSMIFATGASIGLVFESKNGKIPYEISHVIWRLIADKKESHMILVTGGSRELKVIQTAKNEMEQRGYQVKNVYSKYTLQKRKLEGAAAVEGILADLAEGREHIFPRERFRHMTKKERRRHMRNELKAYRKYVKNEEKKLMEG